MERLQVFRRNWPILALMIFYVYLAFHALSGSQGLMSWVDYEQDITRLQGKLETLKQHRLGLEKRVELMQASNLDIDSLDVKAREMVFLAHPEELTIWMFDPQ